MPQPFALIPGPCVSDRWSRVAAFACPLRRARQDPAYVIPGPALSPLSRRRLGGGGCFLFPV